MQASQDALPSRLMHEPRQRKLVDYAKKEGGPRLRSAPAARRLGANPRVFGKTEDEKAAPAVRSGGGRAGKDGLLNEQRIREKRGHLDCRAGPSDWVATASIAQWCFPSRRQQLGRSGDGSAARTGEISEKLNRRSCTVARPRRSHVRPPMRNARSGNADERR